MSSPLRVLIVDDPRAGGKTAYDALAPMAGVEVVGAAASATAALERLARLRPDLLLLNLSEPKLDGLGVLEQLRASGHQVGVIVLCEATDEGAQATMVAMAAGAFDFVVWPVCLHASDRVLWLRDTLRAKLEAFVRVGGVHLKPSRARTRPAVVALGISTGGPQALTQLLPDLPGDLPVPVLVVQHMPPMFTRSLARSLNDRCALRVCEASDGQPVVPGWILIAPGGTQMRVERDAAGVLVRITDDPPERACKPSVDYLFRSVAQVYGGDVLAVLMTGMGRDGVDGCRLLKQRGATIVAQDEASCVVYGMPRELVEQDLADMVTPLDRIANEIIRLTQR